MNFKKIASNVRIDTTSTGDQVVFLLPATPGGRQVKSINYMVRILQCSDTSVTKIGLNLSHGPDGLVSTSHSSPITATLVPASNLLSGDAGPGVLGEWLHPALTVQRSSTGAGLRESVVVDVYEMRKPF